MRAAGPDAHAVIAIRILGVGRYFGAPVVMDGGAQPREAWRSLLRIAGIDVKTPLTEDETLAQRAVSAPGHVLRDITVDIERGSITCIAGTSGSGKSVLLKILAGVLLPTTGRVEIYGDIARLLASGDNIDPRMTAHENIETSPVYRAATTDAAERFAAEVIDFAELQGFEHVPLRTYSTGMLLRLNVALTLCSAASIMLIDDLFAVGDIGFQQKIVEKLLALREQGRTLVVASSDDGLVQQIATRILTLGNGHIVSDSPPRRFAPAIEATVPAEFQWNIAHDLPESDVISMRAIELANCDGGDQPHLDVRVTCEAHTAALRCRPSVTLKREKKIVFRSLYPGHLDLPEPGAFTCAVRIPLHMLASGTYLLTVDVHTYRADSLYLLKARDAITLTVHRGGEAEADRRQPLLTVAFPWEVETMAEAAV